MNSAALPAAQPLDPIGPNCPRRPETYFCRACGRFHVYRRTKLGVRRHSAGPITEDALVGLSTNGTFDAAEMHLLHRFSNWMRRSHPKPLRSPFAAEFSRPPAEFQEKSGLDLGRGYTFPAGLTAADVEGIHAALWLSTQTDGLVVKLWRTIAQLNHLPALPIDSDQVDNAIIGVTSGFCWSDIEFFLAVGGGVGAGSIRGYRTVDRRTRRLLKQNFKTEPGWVLSPETLLRAQHAIRRLGTRRKFCPGQALAERIH
jgi:hypothetical protein